MKYPVTVNNLHDESRWKETHEGNAAPRVSGALRRWAERVDQSVKAALAKARSRAGTGERRVRSEHRARSGREREKSQVGLSRPIGTGNRPGSSGRLAAAFLALTMAALPALVPPLNAVADVRAPGGMGATGIIQTGSQALVPRSTTPLYLIGMDDADTLSDLGDGALFGNPCLCVCRSTDLDEGDDFPYTAEDFLLP